MVQWKISFWISLRGLSSKENETKDDEESWRYHSPLFCSFCGFGFSEFCLLACCSYHNHHTHHSYTRDVQSQLPGRNREIRNRYDFTKLEDALHLFDEMTHKKPLPSIIDVNLLISPIVKMKHYNMAISLFRQVELLGIPPPPPDHYAISILINCHCHLDQMSFGFPLLGKLFKLGYSLESVIVNTLINGLVSVDELEQALSLLDRILKQGFCPDPVTYGALVKGLCRNGKNDVVLSLLRDMESGGLRDPNIVIYNTIIDILCKHELLNEAHDLFSHMKKRGISHDIFTYTSLIRGQRSLGRWDEAQTTLREMLGSNIAPNIVTFNMLIDMYCKEGIVEEANYVLILMIDKGVMPNIITYNSLLDGYCLRGQMNKASRLMDMMVRKVCQPDVVTFNIMISGVLQG